MIEEEPAMESDGFLITDRGGQGKEPRYLVEHYVGGAVRSSRTFASNMEVVEALDNWGDEESAEIVDFHEAASRECFRLFDDLGETIGRRIGIRCLRGEFGPEELLAVVRQEVDAIRAFALRGGAAPGDVQIMEHQIALRIIAEGRRTLMLSHDDGGIA